MAESARTPRGVLPPAAGSTRTSRAGRLRACTLAEAAYPFPTRLCVCPPLAFPLDSVQSRVCSLPPVCCRCSQVLGCLAVLPLRERTRPGSDSPHAVMAAGGHAQHTGLKSRIDDGRKVCQCACAAQLRLGTPDLRGNWGKGGRRLRRAPGVQLGLGTTRRQPGSDFAGATSPWGDESCWQF